MGTVVYVVCTAVVAVLAMSIGLIVSSFKKLSTEEAGLQYDVHQRTLKSRVYTTGLHAGAPGYRFIIFPRVYRTINFANVKCLNKDGLPINLHIQFQYLVSLKAEDLMTIILEFENHDTYKEVISDAALEVIHDICSQYNVTQFQTSRSEFQRNILLSLQSRLKVDFLTNVKDVQVKNIRRPSRYETVVREKEAAKQNIKIAQEERPRILTAAITKKREAETQANITIDNANTNARIALARAVAESEAILNAYQTEASTYQNIMTDQGLDVAGLLSYLSTRALEFAAKPVSINLDAPAKTKFP